MENKLAYSPQSAWKTYSAAREDIETLAVRYMNFLNNSKTERETIIQVMARLRDSGFSEDFGQNKVFRQLRGKALFAAVRGSEPLENGISLIAAHADSPRLDFKQHPLLEQADIAQAKTHYYGGILKYQWLARPLALHGIVVLANGKSIDVRIGEKNDEPVFCISDLLPHLAQKQMDKTVRDAFEAEKLNIILGHCPSLTEEDNDDANSKVKDPVKTRLLEILNERYGIVEEDLITAELEAVPAGEARFVGLDKAIVGGYGQDDRICVFTALEALLSATPGKRTMAVIFWDKEEIGSDGASGASSRFFQYCIEDLVRAWEPQTPASYVLVNSQAISADVQAALDPDFQDVHEKQNAARFGFGPCFSKFTGSRGKYGASEADAEFFARLRCLLNGKKIPWQAAELGKVDHGGGGTVALFLAAYGMQVIDLGPALLSMHSPFELASCVDLMASMDAYRAFFEA